MSAFSDPSALRTQEEAAAVLASIALEETTLRYMISAERKTIQRALEQMRGSEPSDVHSILAVNENAALMLEHVTDIQLVLINKLHKILKRLPQTLPACKTCGAASPCPQQACQYDDWPCPDTLGPEKAYQSKHCSLPDKPHPEQSGQSDLDDPPSKRCG